MMLKKLILIGLMLLGGRSYATHFVGGEITYTTTGNGTYSITLTMYKDCGSNTAGYPSSITVSMLDPVSGSTLSSASLSPGSEISIPNSFSSACVSNLPVFCVSKKVYTGTLTYTGAATNGFVLKYTSCCRNFSISNITSPGSTSMTYKTATFPAGVGIQNNTPVFTVNPPTIVASGIPVTIPFAAYDSDGDSLYYEFTNALNNSISTSVAYNTGFSGTSPLPSNPAATINGNTGVISANVNLQGQYVVAVAISEYRNGVLLTKTQRDYQFNIALVSPMTIALDSRYKPISCSGDTSGVIGVQIINGTAPFTYSWNTGSTSSIINNLGPGTYTVVCEDDIGCIDSLDIVLEDPDTISISPSITSASCNAIADGQISINLSGGRAPFSYFVDSVSYSSSIVTGLLAGTYHILVEDSADLCSIDTVVTLPYDTAWNSVILDSIITPTCSYSSNGEIRLSNASNITLKWLDNNSSSAIRSNLISGTYTVEITNSSGCLDSLTAVVPLRDSLFWDDISFVGTTCFSANNGQINFDAIGGEAPYSYFLNGTAASGSTVDSLLTGSYALTIEDSVGCQIDSTIAVPTDTNWYNWELDTIVQPSCFGLSNGKILFTVDGVAPNKNFTWLDNAQAGLNRYGIEAGSYTLVIDDAALCSDTLNFMVGEPSELLIDSVFKVKTTCLTSVDGVIETFISGGTAPYRYFINGAPATNPTTSLITGAYLVVVVDTMGCSVDSIVNVGYRQNWSNIVLDQEIPPLCFSDHTGEIIMGTTDGNPPNVDWQWSDDPSAPFNRSGLPSNSYVLYISNAAGCQDSIVADINAPDTIKFRPIITEEVCFGDGQGNIDLRPIGGKKPYSITWAGTNYSGSRINETKFGPYYPTLVDYNGCIVTDTIEVLGPDSAYYEVVLQDPRSCSSFDGSIEVIPYGGYPPYSINLDNTNTTGLIEGLGFGDYWLTIIDSNNCLLSDSLALDVVDRYPLFIPNAFTPGNDEINEEFKIGGDPSCFTDVEFVIFNRWGDVVFRTEEPLIDFWKGEDLSGKSDQNSYQYYFKSNELDQIGKITLIK